MTHSQLDQNNFDINNKSRFGFAKRQPLSQALSAILISAALLSGAILAGCQPAPEAGTEEDVSTDSGQSTNPENLVPMSEAAKATVEAFEAEFVAKMFNVQQSQLAEYEALQAADAPDGSLLDTPVEQSGEANSETSATATTEAATETANRPDNISTQNSNANLESEAQATGLSEQAQTNTQASTQSDAQATENINNTADSESDTDNIEALALEKLPLINNTALVEPQILSASEISSRYNVALQSLYLPDEVALPAQAVDTLLNIATLTPDLFANAELAQRLVVKSPALARLLRQYQTWQQIQLQQNEELERLQQQQIEAQQQQSEEFDDLVREFTAKIESYDEQIAKYEERLKEFE